MAKTQAHKVLRFGVFRGKHQIEERVLEKRESVSVGRAVECKLLILSSSMPEKHDLMVYQRNEDKYYLHVVSGMRGRISLGDNELLDLSDLKVGPNIEKRGNGYYIGLNDKSRGKVVFGKISILFQFVAAQNTVVEEVIVQSEAGGVWNRVKEFISLAFLLCVVFSFGLHLSVLLYAMLQDWPRDDELLELPDWYLKREAIAVIEEEVEVPEVEVSEGEGEGTGEDTGEEVSPKVEAKPSLGDSKMLRSERQDAGKKLVAGILGVEGDGLSGIGADILGSAGTISAFDGLSRDDIGGPGSGSLGLGLNLGGSGSATGEAGLKSLGGGAGDGVVVGAGGVKAVNAERKKVEFKVSDDTSIPQNVEAGDRKSLEAVLAKKRIDVERCYQRVIQEHGVKPGRLVVKMTVGTDGSVMKVDITEDQIGSGLSSCVSGKIKRWKFPKLDRPITLMKRWIFG